MTQVDKPIAGNAGAQTITTVAGTSRVGFSGDGGPATSAELHNPEGVAVDANGNVFIADTYNHPIRRIDAITGIIRTVLGTGVASLGGDGGLATGGLCSGPSAVAVDASGNLYIADTNNDRIRRVDAVTGIVTTVAGSGNAEFTGDAGPTTSVALNFVLGQAGLAVDASGNLNIADDRVRKVTAGTNTMTTISGPGAAAFWVTVSMPGGQIWGAPAASLWTPAATYTLPGRTSTGSEGSPALRVQRLPTRGPNG